MVVDRVYRLRTQPSPSNGVVVVYLVIGLVDLQYSQRDWQGVDYVPDVSVQCAPGGWDAPVSVTGSTYRGILGKGFVRVVWSFTCL